MSGISTHVLDLTRGKPAAGVSVTIEHEDANTWTALNTAATDSDGRCKHLLPPEYALKTGIYRIVFDTGAYFHTIGDIGLYPFVIIPFTVRNANEHHHIPLLLTANGYSTYRGS